MIRDVMNVLVAYAKPIDIEEFLHDIDRMNRSDYFINTFLIQEKRKVFTYRRSWKPSEDDKEVLHVENPVYRQCFNVAYENAIENADLDLYFGFAYIEPDGREDEFWYLHSWLVNPEGDVVEPTPVDRTVYVGFKVEKEDYHIFHKHFYEGKKYAIPKD